MGHRPRTGTARRRLPPGTPMRLQEAWPNVLPEEAQPLLLPAGYRSGSGALLGPEGGIVTTTPLLPTEEIWDLDGEERFYQVHLLDRGAVTVRPLPASVLRDQRRIVSLAAQGVDVDTQTAPRLGRFLRDYLRLNLLPRRRQTRRLGWRPHQGGGHYLLHGCHPPDAALHYVADTEEGRTLHAGLRPAGSVEVWTALLRHVLRFPFVVTAVLAACLPPIREILGLPIPSFLLHLMAPSSTGKTLAQMVSLSVWADPANPQWLLHGHATYAGLEALCLRTYGLPVCVQDITLMPPEAVRWLIYAVGNEAFKARGGERRRTQTPWRGVVITSAELPLVHEGSFAGEAARVLSLHGPPFGPPSQATQILLDATLRLGLTEHHGTAGPALVEYLLGLPEGRRAAYRDEWEGLRDEVTVRGPESPLLLRQAPQWAGLYLAAAILDDCLALRALPDLRQAVDAAYEQARVQEPPHPARRAQELLVGEAYAHEAYCFRGGPTGYVAPKRGGRVVGAINEVDGTVALYRQVAEEVLRRAGFASPTATLEAMRAEGLLVADRGHLTSKIQCGGTRRRMVVVRIPDTDTPAEAQSQ